MFLYHCRRSCDNGGILVEPAMGYDKREMMRSCRGDEAEHLPADARRLKTTSIRHFTFSSNSNNFTTIFREASFSTRLVPSHVSYPPSSCCSGVGR